jgi:hypothetical protein
MRREEYDQYLKNSRAPASRPASSLRIHFNVPEASQSTIGGIKVLKPGEVLKQIMLLEHDLPIGVEYDD